MEQKQNSLRPEAATDEQASPGNPGDSPGFADPPLLSDALAHFVEERVDEALGESFPPGARKPRHDGWGPAEIAGFLRALAATGVVEHAARHVRRSPQSAYNFRNGRRGRAFAKVWDAVLINRSRSRLAGEVQARAIAGCVSVRKKDGEIVSEYHYYDNRLAMSLLTRLDRLAEREAASEAHLRSLSEDLEEFIDCVAGGGDPDAFVEERRPAQEAEAAPPEQADPDDLADITLYARLSGCNDYRRVNPIDIDVLDLDPLQREEWDPDQFVRAWRSGFMAWLEMRGGVETAGPGAAICFDISRIAACAAQAAAAAGPDEEIDISDLDPETICDWSDDQLARGWRSRLIQRLGDGFWGRFSHAAADCGADE